jgi:hypothetical protein
MRFLRSKYAHCTEHPDAALDGRNNGDIHCPHCGDVLGRWNLPWSPQWLLESEDQLARGIAPHLPRSVVKWALVRAQLYATRGRWPLSDARSITAAEVRRRWEIA